MSKVRACNALIKQEVMVNGLVPARKVCGKRPVYKHGLCNGCYKRFKEWKAWRKEHLTVVKPS